jgi:hypothetical protein
VAGLARISRAFCAARDLHEAVLPLALLRQRKFRYRDIPMINAALVHVVPQHGSGVVQAATGGLRRPRNIDLVELAAGKPHQSRR